MRVRIARRVIGSRYGRDVSRLFVEIDGRWYMPSWRVYRMIFPRISQDPSILAIYVIDWEDGRHRIVPDLERIFEIDIPEELAREIQRSQSPLMPVLDSLDRVEAMQRILG